MDTKAMSHGDILTALSVMFGGSSATETYWDQRHNKECVLSAHPFGLDTYLFVPRRSRDSRIRLIADPRETESSVNAMLVMIRDTVRHSPQECPIRLRIVRAALEENKHLVYFEVMSVDGTFVCGGCNDFDGEGGTARRGLETVFAFVAALYGIEVKDVTVPMAQAQEVEDRLRKAYDDFKTVRRNMA